jgi:glycosyltransferase involved in cell wall biosynthesis
LKIALVTFNFDPHRPGGLNSVVMRLLESLNRIAPSKVEIISFSNSRFDSNSISFLRPMTYRNPRVHPDGFFNRSQITRVGSIGSEFEFLRYRKRTELATWFESFDLIIVVTGIIQFANVIPKVDVPILVQCATRLRWERESHYKSMGRARRAILKLQLPLLSLQESRVLKSQITFLVENTKMRNWIASKSKRDPEMWYPGLGTTRAKAASTSFPTQSGHFISVGRLNDPRKGWDRLLLAYKKSFDSNPTLPPLVVIGGGDFLQSTQKLADELCEDYPIRILRNAANSERDKALQNASFFLQTSHEEGLGLAALEALSFGIPLICSETDGSREYVREGVSGTLVPQGENFVDEFSEAIKRSQDWDYSILHAKSKILFESVFGDTVSEERLKQILTNVRLEIN